MVKYFLKYLSNVDEHLILSQFLEEKKNCGIAQFTI